MSARRNVWIRFAWFYLLTLLLLCLVPLAQWNLGVSSLDFDAMARAASRQTGATWTSNLTDVVRLAFAAPGLWLLVLGSAVPSLAAILALASTRESGSLRAWLTRFNPARLLQAASLSSICSFVLVVVAVCASLALTLQVRLALGLQGHAEPAALSIFSLAMAVLAAALLDQGAILEEGGWRGYAAHLLQDNGVNPLVASIVIGVAWGLWHVPRDVVSGVVDRLGIVTYLVLYLPAFLAGAIAVSVLASYCMNRLGGSVWPAIAIHGLANDAVGLSGSAAIDLALTPEHQITKALPLLILAIILALLTRARLGRSQLQAAPEVSALRSDAANLKRVTK